MLAGRMSELEYLNQYYEQKGSRMLVVYGQKHIGKTTLVRAFAEDKPNYYYLAKPCSEREQMYQWGIQLKAYERNDPDKDDGICLPDGKDFPEFADIFNAVSVSTGKRVIILSKSARVLCRS